MLTQIAELLYLVVSTTKEFVCPATRLSPLVMELAVFLDVYSTLKMGASVVILG